MDTTHIGTGGTGVLAGAAAGSPATSSPSEGGSFSGTLAEQRQRVAARDVLAAMPPMVSQQIMRSVPGGPAPVSAIDELFKAIKSGAEKPTAEQMDAHDCLMAVTARAADAFDTPDQMWETMREMLGSGPAVQDAVRYAQADATQSSAPIGLATTHDQANTLLGGPLPTSELNWWETVLQLLVKQATTGAPRPVSPLTPAAGALTKKTGG